MKKCIRIANAGGFWGDDLDAFRRQIEGGDVDYISIDFLAEITMSILKKHRNKNPDMGYVPDFVEQVLEMAPQIKQKKIRVLSNAGGINPRGCGQKIASGLAKMGIDLKVAIIEGDDISERLDEFYPEQTNFKNLETGEDFQQVKDKIQSANIYLGLPPLLNALEAGADIIIAGRVTDTSITVAPMVHEFGWKLDDWDKLAAGVIAGHIIECGAQASGGNFSDWEQIESWENFGFPIVEVQPDGTFYVTKHPGTGGTINLNTIREQLLYEMGDPAEYISPDVIADFRTIQLESDGKDRVKVYGVKGRPSTPFFKVSMAYVDGFKASGSIIVSAPQAIKKSETFARTFWKRLNISFEKTNTEYIGYDSCHQQLADEIHPNGIMLRFLVYDHDRKKINYFSKQIAPLILSGPPGVAITGGRPRAQDVMAYWPALIPKTNILTTMSIIQGSGEITTTGPLASVTGFEASSTDYSPGSKQISTETGDNIPPFQGENLIDAAIYDICLARSGDKGDMANIGVIARNENIYEWIRFHFTADYIKKLFKNICKGRVIRYETPNLLGLNFLLEEALDGGGTRSLKIDAQGKTFAQALLAQGIKVPEHVLTDFKNKD